MSTQLGEAYCVQGLRVCVAMQVARHHEALPSSPVSVARAPFVLKPQGGIPVGRVAPAEPPSV